MDDVVSEAVNDEGVDAEGDVGDQLSANKINNLIILFDFAFQLTQPSHHVLYDTHGVLIQGEGQQILDRVFEEGDHKAQRKYLDYFLDEMGGIAVFAQVIVLLPQSQGDESKLLVGREMVDEGLNSMSALLVFDEISQLWRNGL